MIKSFKFHYFTAATITILFLATLYTSQNTALATTLSQSKNNAKVTQMINTIKAKTAAYRNVLGKEELSPRVLAAMQKVPRHEFVMSHHVKHAYKHQKHDIGFGQTLGQPFTIALMLDQLNIKMGDSVLDVGTGVGYTAAILSQLTNKVYTIEIIPGLARKARRLLTKLGYVNIKIKVGDGLKGWSQYAPFDTILVSFAVKKVPSSLVEQLKNNGRMLVPITNGVHKQNLLLITKSATGSITRKLIPIETDFDKGVS